MIHIIGGGTISYVRTHLALTSPAFGTTARGLHHLHGGSRVSEQNGGRKIQLTNDSTLHLTKMADHTSLLVTSEDVARLVDRLVADPTTRVIYMNAALCDYDGQIGETPSGKHAPRMNTRDVLSPAPFIHITPAPKLLGRIRKERKDIFLVAFKTTSGASPDQQYAAALNLLKENSCNLVLANDVVTRNNMIVAPEETRYDETTDRGQALRTLVAMVRARSSNTFTRSTVVPGDLALFDQCGAVPDNLRKVVNHLVQRGAYKPFRGATAGHFAVRLGDGSCLTSQRKTDYTKPGGLNLVRVDYDGLERVTAHGAKPSVGGQSQRIVFEEHDGYDCIVHAHVPERTTGQTLVPQAPQWPNECGSHQCGANTSAHLQPVEGLPGVKAVMLEGHGPNIVFTRQADPDAIIAFIEDTWDLEAKTGGLLVEA